MFGDNLKLFFGLLAVILIVVVFVWFKGFFHQTAASMLGLPAPEEARLSKVKVTIGSAVVTADLAVTPAESARGLSGRTSLGKDDGMLFLFSSPGVHTFWMKGMKIPLDFIWIKDHQIVDLASDIPPPAGITAFKIYSPSAPVNRVLEVNAGWIAAHNVKIGDKVEFGL